MTGEEPAEQLESAARWSAYYQAVAGRSPRPVLLDVLARFDEDPLSASQRMAIDLGCGDGTETLVLLQRGWQVLAIDQQAEALAYVKSKVPPDHQTQLETMQASFEQLVLPAADLVYAGYSLPFCAPTHFDALWAQIVASVRARGRFAGQLFGDRDSWVGEPGMTFHTLDQVRQLLTNFDIELFQEQDEDGEAVSGPKHWHVFHVIARKPA